MRRHPWILLVATMLGLLIGLGGYLIQSHLIAGVILFGGGCAGVLFYVAWLLLRS